MPNRPIRKLLENRKLVSAAGTTTVAEAARLMAQARVGAILVLKKGQVAGIFTESDAVARVLAAGVDPAHTRLARVMTPDPLTISADKPFAHALVLMREHAIRHVPVLERGRAVGVVSIRDALGTELEELEAELERREHITEIIG